MKRITTVFIAIMMLSIGFAQDRDFRSLTLNRQYIIDYIQAYHADKGVTADDIRSSRITGVENAERFDHWSPLVPLLAPDPVPDGWIMMTGNTEADQSSDAFIGDYAVHVESGMIQAELMGGLAVIGDLSFDFITQSVDQTIGEPFTQRPTAISWAIKGELHNHDTAVVMFQSTLNGTDVVGLGGGFLGPDDVNPNEWTEYYSIIEYVDDDIIPDSVIYILTSSAVGMFGDPDTGEPMDIGTLTEGSYILVDNMVLHYHNEVSFKVEDTDGNLLENAHVSIYEDGSTDIYAEGLTDDDGIATFLIEDGDFTYEVALEGYQSETDNFTAEDQDEIVVVLQQFDGPMVIDRAPEFNETMVALDADIYVTFDEDITEIDFSEVTVEDEAGDEIDGLTLSVDGATINFAHDGLTYGTTYIVSIPAGAIDGNDSDIALAYHISWDFSTINPIESITGVDDIDVPFDTPENEAIALLAQTTTIEDAIGNTYDVPLAWTIDSYDATQEGEYDAIGVFYLPDGVHQTDPETDLEVHAKVTVLGPPAIADIDINDDVEDVEVPFATSEANAISELTNSIRISDEDGGEHNVVLTWTIAGYDSETPGDYTATGTFELPFGVVQTDPATDLEVTATVTVLDRALIDGIDINNDVEDISVEFGTSQINAIAQLATRITISDTEGHTHLVNLSWSIQGYNANEAGEYNATGTFNLPTGVYQTDPETDLEVTATVTVEEGEEEENFVGGVDLNKVNIYPNPSQGIINIENVKGANIEVLSIVGQVIKHIDNANNEISVDLTNYAEGAYFIRIDNKVYRVNVIR